MFGACLTQFLIVGMLFAYGQFFTIFEAEFGWPRAVLSGCMSLTILVMGALGAFGGRLSDLYGPRLVLSVTGALFGLGVAGISLVSEPWHLFLIFGCFVGLGMATHDVVTLSTVARWFERRRGVMTGVVKTATAGGQICLPILAAALIAALGWRDAVMVIGLAISVLLVIAALLMARPELGAKGGSAAAVGGGPQIAYRAATRTRVFWTLCAAQLMFFPILGAVPLHIVVHGEDLGLATTEAAALVSVIGAASIAGRLVVGGMSDRIRGRRSYMLCLAPLAASLVALLYIDTPWLLFAAMVVYGFGHGGLFTVVSPTVAEYFGLRDHGAIFGSILFFGALGGAFGPIMAGLAFDVTGSYALAFTTLAALAAMALALVATLPRSIHHEEEKP